MARIEYERGIATLRFLSFEIVERARCVLAQLRATGKWRHYTTAEIREIGLGADYRRIGVPEQTPRKPRRTLNAA